MLELMPNLTLSDLVGGINAILTSRVAICQRAQVDKVLKDIRATKILKQRPGVSWTWSGESS